MTSDQKELARHALGLPNKKRKTNRNHFCTGPGTNDYPAWIEMVGQGEAVYRKGTEITGNDDVFWLTEAGATLALNPGEKLSADTFLPEIEP